MANQILAIRETKRALTNLDNIATYYESQQSGLGVRFANYYYQQIEILKTMPNICRTGKVFGTRELILNDFPFLVVYRIKKDTVEILRVFHQMQKYPK